MATLTNAAKIKILNKRFKLTNAAKIKILNLKLQYDHDDHYAKIKTTMTTT
jgi:hypothetical protein